MSAAPRELWFCSGPGCECVVQRLDHVIGPMCHVSRFVPAEPVVAWRVIGKHSVHFTESQFTAKRCVESECKVERLVSAGGEDA